MTNEKIVEIIISGEDIIKNMHELEEIECVNLSLTQIQCLPEWIGELKNLRSLILNQTQVNNLPKWIGNLVNLQNLDVAFTKISNLPEQIGNLTNLQRLELGETKISSLLEGIGNLSSLQYLGLSRTQISSLPEKIGNLKNLQELNLKGTQINSLPEKIGNLRNLQKLNLRGTQINSLPERIGELRCLKKLYLGETLISSLPDKIGNLLNLQYLDLSRSKISSLPENIVNLTSLEDLNLKETHISRLTENIGNLKNLRSLNLIETRIKSLPEGIGNLKSLLGLYLSEAQISILPENIGKLENLRDLFLRGTQVSSLPENIGNLRRLQDLILSRTRISSLPESIGNLTNLQNLDLSRTRISSLPKGIGNLTNLQSLNLSGTRIINLPENIGNLTNLEHLHLSGTQISHLPESIFKMRNLKKLYLDNTPIKILPDNLYKMKRLKYLDLSNNRLISIDKQILHLGVNFGFELNALVFEGINLANTQLEEMDIDIFKKTREEIQFYYDELEKNMGILNEARVIFIGDGEVGKSTIVNRLIEGKYVEPKTTLGIAIRNKWVKVDKEDVLLHIWDFGGQEIMHSTHQLFLRNNCIYVIVLDGRKEDRPEYWLEFVRRYGKNSPVMLVANKSDQRGGIAFSKTDLLDNGYTDILTKDFKIYYMSAKSGDGFSEFEEDLYKMVKQTRGYKKKWPGPWLDLKKSLEQMQDENGRRKNYIDEEQYVIDCNKAGITNATNQEILLKWMGDLGVVFSYHSKNGMASVDELKVLRPKWITNGIYKIINSEKLKKYGGRIPIREIQKILKEEGGVNRGQVYRGGEIDFVIGLMRDFKFSYSIGQEEFIPMLTKRERTVDLSRWHNVHIHFRYVFEGGMPVPVLYQLIVRMSSDVNTELTWRRGTVLKNSFLGVEALIYIERENLNIYINSNKDIDSAGHYLAIIRNHINYLIQDMTLNYKKYVGIQRNQQWVYCEYDRIKLMLAKGLQTDFINELNDSISLYDILSPIIPYSVMSKLKVELSETESELESYKREEERLQRIEQALNDNCSLQEKNMAELRTIINNFFTQSVHDNNVIVDKIQQLQKKIGAADMVVFKKLDEAIMEIKFGNNKSAIQKVMEALGNVSNAVGLLTFMSEIDFIKNIFLH